MALFSVEILKEMMSLGRSGQSPFDTVLVCEGGDRVLCHGILMSAFSPVLRANLQPGHFKVKMEGDMKIVDLDWAKRDTVTRAIEFAYGNNAETVIRKNNVGDLLCLADQLGCESLRILCEEHLVSMLTTESAGEILEYAEAFNCPKLVVLATKLNGSPKLPIVKELMAKVGMSLHVTCDTLMSEL
jgi:hypothetical protein